MALTAAYFVNELYVPNVTGTSYAEVENLARLNAMIAKYEPIFLKKMIGEDLYTAFAAAMLSNPTSGVWYNLNQQLYNATLLQSPVANYVYFKFWKSAQTSTTSTGESKANVENASAVSIGQKMVDAWNDMVDQVNTIVEWLDENADDYPLWGSETVETFEKVNQWGI